MVFVQILLKWFGEDDWICRWSRTFFVGICFLSAVGVGAGAQDFSQPQTEAAPTAAMVRQANDALASGDLPGALKILTSLNEKMPHNAQILYDLGMTIEALGPPDAESTRPGAPEVKDAKCGPANASLAAEMTAESCYRASIVADAAFAPPRVALGLLLARTGRGDEARVQLRAATTLGDVEPVLKGRAYRALARLESGWAGNGDGSAAGGSGLGRGSQIAPPAEVAEASSDLLAALKLTPEGPEDVLLAAEIARESNDLAGAEGAYRRYLALPGKSGDPEATAELGNVLLAEGRLGEVESLVTAALAHDPGNPAFTALLAQAWLDSGDPGKIAQATPLVESLHARDAGNAAVTRLLARIYLETGHPEQAEPLYAALIVAQGDRPDGTLLDARGEALIREHRPGEAEKVLKQAVADRRGFPTPAAFGDAATHLAFAAEEIDDPATTLQALALRATVLPQAASSLFLEATANDELHHGTRAADLYKQFLAVAHGTLPDQESQARRRLVELEHRQ